VTAYRFRLYVLGGQVGSARAEPDVRKTLDAILPDRYELEVVDLRARPDLAAADGVMVVPTILRLAPSPVRRAVGSLESPAALAAALGLALDP